MQTVKVLHTGSPDLSLSNQCLKSDLPDFNRSHSQCPSRSSRCPQRSSSARGWPWPGVCRWAGWRPGKTQRHPQFLLVQWFFTVFITAVGFACSCLSQICDWGLDKKQWNNEVWGVEYLKWFAVTCPYTTVSAGFGAWQSLYWLIWNEMCLWKPEKLHVTMILFKQP